jgi:hypothetical protein
VHSPVADTSTLNVKHYQIVFLCILGTLTGTKIDGSYPSAKGTSDWWKLPVSLFIFFFKNY